MRQLEFQRFQHILGSHIPTANLDFKKFWILLDRYKCIPQQYALSPESNEHVLNAFRQSSHLAFICGNALVVVIAVLSLFIVSSKFPFQVALRKDFY